MYNISIIGTRHEDLGNCNSLELYKILETLKPQVIFEEMPPSFLDRYYVEGTRQNLESEAITTYLKHFKAIQIPVDFDDIPADKYLDNIRLVHQQVENLTDQNGFAYRNLIDNNVWRIADGGFKYLNSDYYASVNDLINQAIRDGAQKLNRQVVFEALDYYESIHEIRENQMIQNIYDYSEKNEYDTAVFTVGANHLKSLANKIRKYQEIRGIKLNWILNYACP